MTQTIQELEHNDWGEPEHDTGLVRAVNRLRRKPIDAFTIEDLRLMIGQNVGVPWLMPRALLFLEANPFAQGEMYPGDLLSNVLRVPSTYWDEHPGEAERAARVVEKLRTRLHGQRRVRVEEASRLYGATLDGHDSADDALLELAERWALTRKPG